MTRALLSAALFGLSAGQLVLQDPSEIEANKHTLKAAHPKVGDVQTGIKNPTICDSSVKQYSGYLDAADDAKYFMWTFESRSKPATDPLVLWLTGGPGCSGQLALLTENGPCHLDADGKEVINKYSWNSNANVIWVDQPAGTGFSTGEPGSVHDEDGVQKYMYRFMQSFYKELPQFKGRDFYIFGESFAGHYIPAIAHYFNEQNKAKTGGEHIPLKGVGIGNGMTNPEIQYQWYPRMAYDGGKAEGGSLKKGAVGIIKKGLMDAVVPICTHEIHACNAGSNSSCQTAYIACNVGLTTPYSSTGLNPYDMRIKCAKPPLCYDFDVPTAYLNSARVQAAIGVNATWASCNMDVNKGFMEDFMHNYHLKIPALLADGIEVLAYAGDVDYICNWLGNKKWVLDLEWPNKAAFNAAEDKAYNVADKQVGRLRSSNGFHFLQIYQAGHLVPMDQPETALAFVNEMIGGKLGKSAPSDVVV